MRLLKGRRETERAPLTREVPAAPSLKVAARYEPTEKGAHKKSEERSKRCLEQTRRPYRTIPRSVPLSLFLKEQVADGTERKRTERNGTGVNRAVVRSVQVLNGVPNGQKCRRSVLFSGKGMGSGRFFGRCVFRAVPCGTEFGTVGSTGEHDAFCGRDINVKRFTT